MFKLLTFIILNFLFTVHVSSFGQTGTTNYAWKVTINGAVEEHDKRLFSFPLKEATLSRQPENWGTYYYGIRLERLLRYSDFERIHLGLGYVTETQTFERPFNPHELLGVTSFPGPLFWTNRYRIRQLQVPFIYSYRISRSLWANADLNSRFSFHKSPRSGEPDNAFDLKKFKFDFYSVALKLGLSYTIGRCVIATNYRVFQLKRIDRVIFSPSLRTWPAGWPDEKTIESYNPVNIQIAISYLFKSMTVGVE